MGVRDERWKLVTDGVDERVFALASEGSAQEKEVATIRLRGQLRRWLEIHPLPPDAIDEIDPELTETLNSLGYL